MKKMNESDFESAQQARRVLSDEGWIPLTTFTEVGHGRTAEHWVKGPLRCILHYKGDEPEKSDLNSALHVEFFRTSRGDIMARCPDYSMQEDSWVEEDSGLWERDNEMPEL